MRVNREPVFSPLTVTLETEDEVRVLKDLLGSMSGWDYARALGMPAPPAGAPSGDMKIDDRSRLVWRQFSDLYASLRGLLK